MDTNNVKPKSEGTFSWLPFWEAGFLFTLGYVRLDILLSTYPWYQQVVVWLLSWFLWPIILGFGIVK